MEKYIHKILELNKKLYLDTTINDKDYKTELISCLQSMVLDYNMFMQIESHNILHKFTHINTNTSNIFTNEDNRDNRDNRDTNRSSVKTVQHKQLTLEHFLNSHSNTTVNEHNIHCIDNEDIEHIEHIEHNDIIIDNEDIEDHHSIISEANYIDNESDNDIEEYESDNEYNSDNNNSDNNSDNNNSDTEYNEGVGLEQCCARLGLNRYNINLFHPEFIDSYPADTYIDDEGCVFGDPCSNKVELFDEDTNFFCNAHKFGYEDIRQMPSSNLI